MDISGTPIELTLCVSASATRLDPAHDDLVPFVIIMLQTPSGGSRGCDKRQGDTYCTTGAINAREIGYYCTRPSPESITMPVARPGAYRESTAWIVTYMAGTSKVSSMIWVMRSRHPFGDRLRQLRFLKDSSKRSFHWDRLRQLRFLEDSNPPTDRS